MANLFFSVFKSNVQRKVKELKMRILSVSNYQTQNQKNHNVNYSSNYGKVGISGINFCAELPKIAKFDVIKPELWSYYKTIYNNNIIESTAEFAQLMETMLEKGKKLEDIVRSAASEVMDKRGSEFVPETSIDILSCVWRQGEDLKNWALRPNISSYIDYHEAELQF